MALCLLILKNCINFLVHCPVDSACCPYLSIHYLLLNSGRKRNFAYQIDFDINSLVKKQSRISLKSCGQQTTCHSNSKNSCRQHHNSMHIFWRWTGWFLSSKLYCILKSLNASSIQVLFFLQMYAQIYFLSFKAPDAKYSCKMDFWVGKDVKDNIPCWFYYILFWIL